MDPRLVNPLISSNIIAPMVFTAIFMFVFIPYSFGAFFEKRKSEYGILMTLGMTEKEVLANMLFENLTVSLLSLMAGMAAGTFLSLLFLGIIRNVIGIGAFSWNLSLEPYALTVKLYLAVVAFTLLIQTLCFVKTQITDLLKAKSRGEKEVKHSAFCLAGWPASRPKVVDVGKAFVIRHFRSYRTVTFIAVNLFGIGIFLAGLSLVTYPNLLNNAESYSPYDLVYVQAGGKNEMTLEKAAELLSKYGVTVTASAKVPFLRNGAFNLFPVSGINCRTGSDYTVDPGTYLAIYQYDLNDGYEYEMNLSGKISFKLSSGTRQLEYAGQDVRILFNRNSFADITLLLNDADYKMIEEQGDGYIPGVILCFAFSSWRDSGRGLSALQEALSAQNDCVDASQEEYFKISSKLEEYETARQSARFLIFVILFVVLLFYISANTIIYFKIQGEAEDEKRLYHGLYRIGITADEMRGILTRKNKRYCLIPLYSGAAAGILFCFAISAPNGYGLAGIAFAAAASAFLALLQGLMSRYITHCDEKMLGI
ncbi:MAG: ABC transporter permease [Clostridiaceae bacterium]|nr:ABC transporter permease [Clostridiaceae bacterium]